MKTTKNISFFMPHTKIKDYESAYELAKNEVTYQMRWPITNRRIKALTYVSDKKQVTTKIGEAGKYEHRYEAVAILESAKYLIIVTKTISGSAGPTILVDTRDVIAIDDFTSDEPARPSKIGATNA